MTGAPLTLYNSFTRQLEPFAPIDAAKGARVYSCGPTVYSDPHLGNLRAYVYEYNDSAFTQKLNFSMNYARTYNESQNNLWPPENGNGECDINHGAMAWDDTPS